MAGIWDTDGGVYFGHQVEAARDKDYPLSGIWPMKRDQHRYKGDRHIVTLGPNGSGKTMRLLLPNLYHLKGWSVLVVDPKGDLAIQTHLHRRATGSEIVTLDPFGVIGSRYPRLVEKYPDLRSRSLNPIAALDPASDYFPDDGKKIGEALIKVEGKEPHWSQSAQALVAGIAMALRVIFPKDADFQRLRTTISMPADKLAGFIAADFLANLPAGMEAVASKLNRFTRYSDHNTELASVLATAITQTDWLDSTLIQKSLAEGTYEFGEMKNRPITVYLILPPYFLETHATWLRLMITAVLLPLIRSPEGKVPVLFMLDEFAQLGRLEVIEQNMALMRSYGIKLWPVFQDLAQAKDIYERRWESFIGNAGVLHAFAPQDSTSRDYLSGLSGQRPYWTLTTSTGASQNLGAQSSQGTSTQSGWQHHQGPVWWPQHLAMMEDGHGVLFWRGNPLRGFYPYPTELPDVRDMVNAAMVAAK